MKIAIINLTSGGMSGGYKKYLLNILPRIAANPEVEAVLCASPHSIAVQSWFKQLPNLRFTSCRTFRLFRRGLGSALKKNMEEFSPDVVFVPLERYLRFKNVPVVNMLQNMEPIIKNIDKNPFAETVRQWVQYKEARKAIKNADGVISLSKFVSDYIMTQWGILNRKIGLIYHGIDSNEKSVYARPDIVPHNWEDKFIFTAGSIRPARGLKDLLLAMKEMLVHEKKPVKLIIAGESSPQMFDYQKNLKNWVLANNLSESICWAGSLNENEMAWCYKNCKVFVMTSRVESFGMIGGEAMTNGCICISADNPCLPELFSDAAIYYPPKDNQALSREIRRVLSWDDSQRKVMTQKARIRASEFSWDICAEKTVEELKKVIKNRELKNKN